mmetsp:Transcript_16861/g.55159  ORF Transcript_16861/g.55159 Transcript_16861/m.55159 type:complete len:204 (-) Transcript_16861:851-1462(-)
MGLGWRGLERVRLVQQRRRIGARWRRREPAASLWTPFQRRHRGRDCAEAPRLLDRGWSCTPHWRGLGRATLRRRRRRSNALTKGQNRMRAFLNFGTRAQRLRWRCGRTVPSPPPKLSGPLCAVPHQSILRQRRKTPSTQSSTKPRSARSSSLARSWTSDAKTLTVVFISLATTRGFQGLAGRPLHALSIRQRNSAQGLGLQTR